jgi:hypothetical protein
MKSSVWIVIALVTGIVGFLMGYGVSSMTGTRRAADAVARSAPAPTAPAPQADAGGYGGAAAPAPKPDAGGYGAEKPAAAAPASSKSAQAEKPKAAGY